MNPSLLSRRSARKLASLFSLATGHTRTFWRRVRPALSPNSIYSREYPTDQAAVDLFMGEWTSTLPGLKGGRADLFEKDGRPAWVEKQMGGLQGKTVLELGPLEGAHTYQLERFGAAVEAIESNKFAFQRCLIAKNILGLDAKFLLGDFTRFTAETERHYDLVFASGVLYHMQNPLETLRDLCRIGDQVFLWTHYYDADAIAKIPFNKKSFASAVQKDLSLDGLTVTCFERIYARKIFTYFAPGFCGGMHMKTYWMKFDDILKSLEKFGFEIAAQECDLGHPNGPAAMVFARRKLAPNSVEI